MNRRLTLKCKRLSAGLIVLFASAAAHSQSVIYRGLTTEPLGAASLSINSSDQLVISGITPSGNDGVSINTVGAASFLVEAERISTTAPVGTIRRWTVRGRVNGVPNVVAGQWTMTKQAANLRLDCTFQGLSNPARTVELFFNAAPVGSQANITPATVAFILGNTSPDRIAIHRRIGPLNRTAFEYEWNTPVSVQLPGGGVFTCNRVRVSSQTMLPELDIVAEVDDQNSDVPEMSILDMIPEPACPGDVNGDNLVNLTDLSILLANFGLSEGVALQHGDIDLNGVVNLSDLSTLLANFGQICE